MTTTTQDAAAFRAWLRDRRACSEASTWADGKTAEQSWTECHRGDWLLWLAATAGVDRKVVVTAACATARKALRFVPDGELRPLRAIEITEAWCRGEATSEQVRQAGAAAAAYAYAAYAAAAAADAAAAAAAAAYAYAAYAAYAYAAAYAAADAAAAARRAMQAECADLVRQIIPWLVVRDSLDAQGEVHEQDRTTRGTGKGGET